MAFVQSGAVSFCIGTALAVLGFGKFSQIFQG
jgi:hypothetical protein